MPARTGSVLALTAQSLNKAVGGQRAVTAFLVKMRLERSAERDKREKNKISAIYGQSKAEAI